MSLFLEKLSHINTIILDVDGVMTDGGIIINNNGDITRTYNVKDGYAIQLAIKKGIRVMAMSGSYGKSIDYRLGMLGISSYQTKVKNKLELLNEWISQYQLKKEEILAIGDDMPELELAQSGILFCCPSDAIPEIKQHSAYISQYAGGHGVVRDIFEKVLKAKGLWKQADIASS